MWIELNLARAIYGTVLATSLVAAFTEDDSFSELEIAVSVLVTSLVFWLAHVHAELLASRYAAGRPLGRAEILGRLRNEWPLVQAAVPLVLVLALGELALNSRLWAERLAIGLGVGMLIALGIAIGRKERLSLPRLIGLTALNASFGVVIVLLKVLVH